MVSYYIFIWTETRGRSLGSDIHNVNASKLRPLQKPVSESRIRNNNIFGKVIATKSLLPISAPYTCCDECIIRRVDERQECSRPSHVETQR